MMRYLICPDSFKGSMSAADAAEAMWHGVAAVAPAVVACCRPLADGGEGTAEILSAVKHAERVSVKGPDALGAPHDISYYMAADGSALMDVASAIGLADIAPERRDVMRASSFGAGVMLADALSHGARRIVIGLGGSATCDGGRGMYRAMKDAAVPKNCDITVLCDVDNPLFGPRGAACVFAPQKGASADQVRQLDAELREWNRQMILLGGRDTSLVPGAGAAGGIGAMLASLYGARLMKGIDFVMDALDLESEIAQADMILTGEGKIDSQTIQGKTLSGVVATAEKYGKPVVGFGGIVEADETLAAKFAGLVEITPDGMSLKRAMLPETAAENLRSAVEQYLINKK